MIASIFTVLLTAGTIAKECPDPDTIVPPEGCNPESVEDANLDACLPKKKSLFGVSIRAAPDVPDWAFTYASNVLARYLDSDQDGQPDDSKLAEALSKTASQYGMLGFAILKCRGSIGRSTLKDSWLGIARTQGQESMSSDDRFQRQVIEELHHGIYHGLEFVYPSVFSSSEESELKLAIREAYGNCQESAVCAMAGNCQHYTCHCSADPDPCTDAGQYDCSFKTGSCDGVFHYATPSCDMGCLVTEGFYHAWTTAYGYKCAGRSAEMASEWELCTEEELANNPRAAKLYELVTGNAASQKTLGYVLPSVLPDGIYNPSQIPTPTPSPTAAPTPAPGPVQADRSFKVVLTVPFSLGLMLHA